MGVAAPSNAVKRAITSSSVRVLKVFWSSSSMASAFFMRSRLSANRGSAIRSSRPSPLQMFSKMDWFDPAMSTQWPSLVSKLFLGTANSRREPLLPWMKSSWS